MHNLLDKDVAFKKGYFEQSINHSTLYYYHTFCNINPQSNCRDNNVEKCLVDDGKSFSPTFETLLI